MKTCETCRYYMASLLQEPCESCHWDGTIGQDPTNWKAPTNADRIRAMSDEKLAELFTSFYYYGHEFYCPAEADVGESKCASSYDCRECFLNWLKQECG